VHAAGIADGKRGCGRPETQGLEPDVAKRVTCRKAASATLDALTRRGRVRKAGLAERTPWREEGFARKPVA